MAVAPTTGCAAPSAAPASPPHFSRASARPCGGNAPNSAPWQRTLRTCTPRPVATGHATRLASPSLRPTGRHAATTWLRSPWSSLAAQHWSVSVCTGCSWCRQKRWAGLLQISQCRSRSPTGDPSRCSNPKWSCNRASPSTHLHWSVDSSVRLELTFRGVCASHHVKTRGAAVRSLGARRGYLDTCRIPRGRARRAGKLSRAASQGC